MNTKQNGSILKAYLGFLPAWFDLRKKEILKDSINIEQWQINMNYLVNKHGTINSSERNAFNNWRETFEDPFIACLDLEKHATQPLVNMAAGFMPGILNSDQDRNWFLAAYPDVFDYFYPQTNSLAEDFDAETQRVEEHLLAIEAVHERMQQYLVTGKGNQTIYLVRMKNFYKNELHKNLLLSVRMDTTPTVNENIQLLVENLRRNGKQVPARLSEIPDFPYSQFDQLQAAILSGAVQMKQFPLHYDARLFDLLASPFQRFLSTFYTAVAFLVPLISIVMAFVHSWWWLLGISAIAVGLSRKKRLYIWVILSSAFQSEAVFSFLYFVRQVCIRHYPK